MNILPHKSWHVRTKRNIERVRKDEEKAAEEEKERQRKISLAEQEARTDLLRSRARSRLGELEDSKDAVPLKLEDSKGGNQEAVVAGDDEAGSGGLVKKNSDSYTSTGHINFFKDVEAGESKFGKNKEHEAEKKAEKEKWEKDIGLLTYLGQSAVESQEAPPWYLAAKRKKSEEEECNLHNKDSKLKASLDPMAEMTHYLSKKKHKHKDKDREKHRHKHKHKHREREKDRQEQPKQHSSSTKTMAQLRAERLQREQAERQRTKQLLTSKTRDSEREVDTDEYRGDRDRGYNNVFNPDFIRRPRSKHYE